jgi:hypothetical protein
MTNYKHSAKTERSGKLAEAACLRVFGVTEPNIEVKAVAAHNNHSVIKLTQLERSGDKDYVFVVYHRQHKYTRGRKRAPVCTLSIEQAFEQPLEFVVVPGAKLCGLVIGSYVRFLREVNGPSGHFYVYPALAKLREAALQLAGHVIGLENGHRLVGPMPRSNGAIREARLGLPSRFAPAGEPPF